jgi:hypothetical protein
MTPVGHSLTGLAIGCVVCPATFSLRGKAITLAAFVLLANIPDLPLPGWGHERYDISHSVFVTTAAIVALAIILVLLPWSRRVLTPALVLGGAAAWYSHLLLDTFYNHGEGLAMFWPLSHARLALPIPWFTTMDTRALFSEHNARVFAIEGVVYGAVLVLAVVVRYFLKGRIVLRSEV